MRRSCSPAVPDLSHRFMDRPRPIPTGAIASALMLHAAGLAALIAFGYGVPAQPAPEAVVEVTMALEPAPPEPQPAEPAASGPVAAPQVAEPVAPPLPEPPAADPSPAIATVEPPIPDVVPEPIAPVPPVDVATLPDSAPPIPSTPAPVPPSMRPPVQPQPVHPPTQHAPHTASAAPRSINVPQDSAASAAAVSKPTSPGGSADQEAALEARIRDAVQAAVRYPPAARMMGVTGRARVRFDYRSGSVADPMLAQSSGTAMLDEAALAAARAAHYPPAPAPIEGRLLRLLVWVEFRPG